MLDMDRNANRKKYWTFFRSLDFGDKKFQCIIEIEKEKHRNDERMQIQIQVKQFNDVHVVFL